MTIVYQYHYSYSPSTVKRSFFEMLSETTTSSPLHQLPDPYSKLDPPPGFSPDSRKRSARPSFASHPGKQQPPESSRRKGQPPKARPISPSHEIETGDDYKVSPKLSKGPSIATVQKSLHEDNQVGKQSCQCEPSPFHCHQAGKTTNMTGGTSRISSQCVEEANSDSDNSLIESPRPVSGDKSVRNVCLDDQVRLNSFASCAKLLMDGGRLVDYQPSEDQTKRNSRSCNINNNCLSTLESIYTKHGDIMQNCWLKSDSVKFSIVCHICNAVEDLQHKQVKDLAMSSLDSYYATIMDVENMNVNVLWLRKRLDEIRDAIKLFEVKTLKDDKCRLLENIEERTKVVYRLHNDIERLKSESEVILDQVAQDTVKVEKLDKEINARTSKCREFPHAHLMDGLI